MNILLVNHYAGGPQFGMEFRPHYMAREWGRMGHNVIIVAASYSHLRSKQPMVKATAEHQTIDDVKYIWFRTNPYHGNGLARIKNMMMFTYHLCFHLKNELKNFVPDLIISSSTYPFDFIPLKRLSKKFNAKICFEVHDLWPLSPMEFGGYSKYHPFIMAVQWSEDYAYKHSNFVVSLLPTAESYMVSRGMKKEKFHHIPNGIALDEWNENGVVPDEHYSLLKRLRENNKFIVGYAGSHGLANSLISLIQASGHLSQEYAFVFVGDGPEKSNLQKTARQYQFTNIYFLPPVPKKSIPSLLKHFDVVYVSFQKQSLLRFGISPNKMFDYMMAKIPIVQAIESGNNLVEEYSCGVSVEPENPEDIARGIKVLKDMPIAKRIQLGENGKKAVVKYHDYRTLCSKFIEIALAS